jgi:hypothetical protein
VSVPSRLSNSRTENRASHFVHCDQTNWRISEAKAKRKRQGIHFDKPLRHRGSNIVIQQPNGHRLLSVQRMYSWSSNSNQSRTIRKPDFHNGHFGMTKSEAIILSLIRTPHSLRSHWPPPASTSPIPIQRDTRRPDWPRSTARSSTRSCCPRGQSYRCYRVLGVVAAACC